MKIVPEQKAEAVILSGWMEQTAHCVESEYPSLRFQVRHTVVCKIIRLRLGNYLTELKGLDKDAWRHLEEMHL